MAHITKWVPTRDAVLNLAPILTRQFFTRNPTLTERTCIEQAARSLGCQIDKIQPTAVQGADSFTLFKVDGAQDTLSIAQFRDLSSPLDIDTINLARKTYGDVAPCCEMANCELSEQVHVYLMTLVDGIAFSAAQKVLYLDNSSRRLTRTVTDLASFVLYP
jgi:hypothetical protein